MNFVSPPGEAPTIAISKPPLLALLTNLGNKSTVVFGIDNAGLGNNTEIIDILSCVQWRTGPNGEIHVKREHGLPQVSFYGIDTDMYGYMLLTNNFLA
jgi:alpha-amylase